MHKPECTGRRQFLATIGAALLIVPAIARAARAAAGTTPDGRAAWLRRIEAYLNSITTMKAGFLQIASTGEVANGTFYMRRPGKLRIEYAPPSPVLIVGDGHHLIYYDKELETANMVPIGDTLASFLVREDVRLSGDVAVTDFAHDKGALRVTLARASEPEGGSLALLFNDDPLRLRQWIVTDAHGVSTRVALTDPEFGGGLADGLFEAAAPERP